MKCRILAIRVSVFLLLNEMGQCQNADKYIQTNNIGTADNNNYGRSSQHQQAENSQPEAPTPISPEKYGDFPQPSSNPSFRRMGARAPAIQPSIINVKAVVQFSGSTGVPHVKEEPIEPIAFQPDTQDQNSGTTIPPLPERVQHPTLPNTVTSSTASNPATVTVEKPMSQPSSSSSTISQVTTSIGQTIPSTPQNSANGNTSSTGGNTKVHAGSTPLPPATSSTTNTSVDSHAEMNETETESSLEMDNSTASDTPSNTTSSIHKGTNETFVGNDTEDSNPSNVSSSAEVGEEVGLEQSGSEGTVTRQEIAAKDSSATTPQVLHSSTLLKEMGMSELTTHARLSQPPSTSSITTTPTSTPPPNTPTSTPSVLPTPSTPQGYHPPPAYGSDQSSNSDSNSALGKGGSYAQMQSPHTVETDEDRDPVTTSEPQQNMDAGSDRKTTSDVSNANATDTMESSDPQMTEVTMISITMPPVSVVQPEPTLSQDNSTLVVQPEPTPTQGNSTLVVQPEPTPTQGNSTLVVQPEPTPTQGNSTLVVQPEPTPTQGNSTLALFKTSEEKTCNVRENVGGLSAEVASSAVTLYLRGTEDWAGSVKTKLCRILSGTLSQTTQKDVRIVFLDKTSSAGDEYAVSFVAEDMSTGDLLPATDVVEAVKKNSAALESRLSAKLEDAVVRGGGGVGVEGGGGSPWGSPVLLTSVVVVVGTVLVTACGSIAALVCWHRYRRRHYGEWIVNNKHKSNVQLETFAFDNSAFWTTMDGVKPSRRDGAYILDRGEYRENGSRQPHLPTPGEAVLGEEADRREGRPHPVMGAGNPPKQIPSQTNGWVVPKDVMDMLDNNHHQTSTAHAQFYRLQQ